MVLRTKPRRAKRTTGDMRRFSVGLPADLYAELERIAKRDSRSLGWVARRAVEELVRQEQPLFHQDTK